MTIAIIGVLIIIIFLLFGIQLCLTRKILKNIVQASPLESGFEAIMLASAAISSPFVFIAVIFVLFDLEIVLIFPLISEIVDSIAYLELFLIVIFIALSLALEWKYSGLKWQI